MQLAVYEQPSPLAKLYHGTRFDGQDSIAGNGNIVFQHIYVTSVPGSVGVNVPLYTLYPACRDLWIDDPHGPNHLRGRDAGPVA